MGTAINLSQVQTQPGHPSNTLMAGQSMSKRQRINALVKSRSMLRTSRIIKIDKSTGQGMKPQSMPTVS